MTTGTEPRAHSTFDVFELRESMVADYGDYLSSFLNIKDARIREKVDEILSQGMLWPEPLVQMNPNFEPGHTIDQLVDQGILHQRCREIFAIKDEKGGVQRRMRLHRHQQEALEAAQAGDHYVLTTGTGSGKSLSYIVPIVDHVLRNGSGKGIQALIVYPMNALANSQMGELERFLKYGFGDKPPVSFARYTGQEKDEQRNRIKADPPDILLTNYVMMELVLTRPFDRQLVEAAQNLRFLVFDELHTYRGRQGADVALLARRIRERCAGPELICVGTSATLSSDGDGRQRETQVAQFASQIFGVNVKPERVIGETLQPVTQLDYDPDGLRRAVQESGPDAPSYQEFVTNALSCWIETTIGLRPEAGTGRLVRATPLPITGSEGAAHRLAEATGLPRDLCEQAIKRAFLRSYQCQPHPDTGRQPFAFRLHQMFSKGDTIYASLDDPQARYLTLSGQQFVPGTRDKVLLPLVFCRECGQEYYCVRRGSDGGRDVFSPRALLDRHDDDTTQAGYLYYSPDTPWPEEPGEVLRLVPDDWLEEHRGNLRIKKSRLEYLPQQVKVGLMGVSHPWGEPMSFVPAPFRFCLHCGVAYTMRQRSDIGKLAILDTSGRSTATSLLTLSVLRGFEFAEGLRKEARKLLSFTDNRQDASLQAGHFNDFVQIGWLRSALHLAAKRAGSSGIRHDELTHQVFAALGLSPDLYAANPTARFQAKEENERALREVLGYWLYRDLRRGWRINFPNLEQCGLLEIEYASLDELCQATDVWQGLHPALVSSDPDKRRQILHTLLDFMRRELCLRVDYLEGPYQERIRQLSNQRLIPPWALDEEEAMEHSFVLFPRASRGRKDGGVYLSSRGGFGQYLRRHGVLDWDKLSLDDTELVIRQLLAVLEVAGLVQQVREGKDGDDVPGYQIPASAMRWVAGDGTKVAQDPIRRPRASAVGGSPNRFFIRYYTQTALKTHGLQAREHTAQVPNDQRIQREKEFRKGDLPVLFCSPTMELGVDIAQLNVVSMRNVPPTPANYAQRSGRAGRSGQPALVFTYCTSGSPHDQYFFRRPERMVAGSVSLPRLDLTNQELLEAHVRAIWLAATEQSLGSTLREVLDLSLDPQRLPVLPSVRQQLSQPAATKKAAERAERVLSTLRHELEGADWYSKTWLDDTLRGAFDALDQACERWRDLYRSAHRQMDAQHRITKDHSRAKHDRDQALRLYREAKAQLELLLEEGQGHSDFYSYRYFASEGFLPGYNFPRLPLSAFIPGRREREFIQRPRFLAISEFGPRSIVYHEGARYLINRVILPVDSDDVMTGAAKICRECGYLHPITPTEDPDLCHSCGGELPIPLGNLFRMRHVSTRRRDRIHCDEEERFRLGYDLLTSVRFPSRGGEISKRVGVLEKEGQELARITYGQAATLWRINLGWRRRKEKADHGFVLDVERGYWARDERQEDDPDDPMSKKTAKVIPFVEDRRNCLLLEPKPPLDVEALLSLQWALKNAIQVLFQLEDNELAAEPLPTPEQPRCLLFYEAAEGGAGVLRRLLDDPQAMGLVAREALSLCHFDPATGEDLRRGPRASEDCEAACYDCLLSYGNQRDHKFLDRQMLKEVLLPWTAALLEAAPAPVSRAEHLGRLRRLCDSELERRWLGFLDEHLLNLPTDAQVFIEKAKARPDFLYSQHRVAVYVDGHPHSFPDRQARDREMQERLEDLGYQVIRFAAHQVDQVAEPGSHGDWEAVVRANPHVFGRPIERPEPELDLALFDGSWHSLVKRLAQQPGWRVEPGGDLDTDGRVVGCYEAELLVGEKRLRLIDPSFCEITEMSCADGVLATAVDPADVEGVLSHVAKRMEETS